MANIDAPDQYPPHFLDAFSEIVNIGIGRAAGVLNRMITSRVTLRVPHIEIIPYSRIGEKAEMLGNETLSSVKINLTGEITGSASLLFSPDSASKLVAMLTGEPMGSPDLDSLKTETLNELGNILLNNVLGSIANMCNLRMKFSIPYYNEGLMREMFSATDDGDSRIVIVHTTFSVQEQMVEGTILLLFTLATIGNLMAGLEKNTQ